MVNELLRQRREQMFPKLSEPQIGRLAAHGQRIQMDSGQLLVEAGRPQTHVFAVLAGSVEILLRNPGHDPLQYILTAGDFSGEMSTLRGTNAQTCLRVRQPGEAVAIPAEQIRDIVQTDADLSELLMRRLHPAAHGIDFERWRRGHAAGFASLRRFVAPARIPDAQHPALP